VPRVNDEVGGFSGSTTLNIHEIAIGNTGDFVEARSDGSREGSSEK